MPKIKVLGPTVTAGEAVTDRWTDGRTDGQTDGNVGNIYGFFSQGVCDKQPRSIYMINTM